MLDLETAIKHCEDVANDRAGCCEDCAEEHRQLAEWLKELKQLRELTRWIPVNERLPEEAVRVLVYAERNAYNKKGKFRKRVIDIGWQIDGIWHIDGCSGVKGIDWMPLPEPYRKERSDKE